MEFWRKLVRGLMVLGVIAAGGSVYALLVRTKPQAQRKPTEEQGVLVEVMVAQRGNHPVDVPAQGTVQAAEQVSLAPEVGGRVVWRHSQLVPGGMVKKGQTLVRLDAQSYALAMAQQAAQVDRARTELALEHGRKSVAEREWELMQKGPGAPEASNSDLALREPQLRSAKVSVEAAENALAAAKLNVSRTQLRAPFNAFVQVAQAEPGQLVNAGASVATLVGTDKFWVQVSVPVENLSWLDVPGVRGEQGAVARISQDVGTTRIEREGRLLRLLGDLDPVGRMARVLIEIEDPFNKQRETGPGELPLLLGAFVDVEIDAGSIDDVVRLPRRAVRDGRRVFVVDGERKLAIRPLQIVWRGDEWVLAKSGVEQGEQVIVSRLSTPVEGMLLRLAPDAKGKKGAEGPVAEKAAP